jgi:hypothetical protein
LRLGCLYLVCVCLYDRLWLSKVVFNISPFVVGVSSSGRLWSPHVLVMSSCWWPLSLFGRLWSPVSPFCGCFMSFWWRSLVAFLFRCVISLSRLCLSLVVCGRICRSFVVASCFSFSSRLFLSLCSLSLFLVCVSLGRLWSYLSFFCGCGGGLWSPLSFDVFSLVLVCVSL